MAAEVGTTVLYAEPSLGGEAYIPAVVYLDRDSWTAEAFGNPYGIPQPNVDRVHLMYHDPNQQGALRFNVAEGTSAGTYKLIAP